MPPQTLTHPVKRIALPAMLIALAWFSGPAFAALPQAFEAVYKAKYRGISVTATRALTTREDGSQYYSFIADSLIANLEETSLFQWSETQQIVPLHYTYRRSVLGRKRTAELDFDWKRNKVTNNVEGTPWEMSVPAKVQDKLSYHIQLRSDLINGRPLRDYDIADGGKLKTYRFEIVGEETLKTPAGKFSVVKVRRIRENDEKRQTVIWFAKDWNYLVVRLQQEEDGKTYEIDMASATLNGKAVKGKE